MIRSLLLGLICTLGYSQTNPFDQRFATAKATALTAAAEVLTVQHLATNARVVQFQSAYIFCSVACTVTLERSGTAASTTANTIINLNPNNVFVQTTQCTAFNTSNVGTGTVINIYNLTAGAFLTVDLTNFELPGGVADNLTLRTNSITGSVQLQLTWQEK